VDLKSAVDSAVFNAWRGAVRSLALKSGRPVCSANTGSGTNWRCGPCCRRRSTLCRRPSSSGIFVDARVLDVAAFRSPILPVHTGVPAVARGHWTWAVRRWSNAEGQGERFAGFLRAIRRSSGDW